MKKLELQNFGVVEMDAMETRETDGGNMPYPIVLWFARHPNAAATYRFFSDFADGFNNEEINNGYRQVTGKSL